MSTDRLTKKNARISGKRFPGSRFSQVSTSHWTSIERMYLLFIRYKHAVSLDVLLNCTAAAMIVRSDVLACRN